MRLIWRDCCSFNSIELSDIVLIALRTPGGRQVVKFEILFTYRGWS